MNELDLDRQAEAWIRYFLADGGLQEQEETAWATDTYDLEYDDPETYWLLALAIYARVHLLTEKDRYYKIIGVLSAGPIEDLLVKYGDQFIERIETKAKSDPKFAHVLGGVWKSSMNEEVWKRLNQVWDRRGWDGIPEL